MTRKEVLSHVRGFIEENFLYMRPDFQLGDDASLMGTGIVDSMGVMEVIQFLEDDFGVVVQDIDITEENLGSIDAIAAYVAAHASAVEHQTA